MTAGGLHALVIAYDFPPHAAIGTMRTLRVVRRLHESGWRVTVLTSDPRSFLASTPIDVALLTQVPPEVRILRARSLRPWSSAVAAIKGILRRPAVTGAPDRATPNTPPRRTLKSQVLGSMSAAKNVVGAMLSIPDREVGWLIPAIVQGTLMKLRHGPPDVIYSSAPPWTGQLVAVALRQVLRCPWVADFRDPWARAPWRGDRYRFALGAASVLERLVITRADRIVFVADGNRSDFLAHYGQPFATKFDHVPNGCDPAEFEGLERPPRNGRIPHVMVHAGSLYAGRTPLPLLKALVRGVESGAIDRAGFRLKFIGANANADLPGTCRQLGVEDMVEFLPRVPRRDSLRTMVSASSLLLLQPGHTVSVPGKLYEYLAARRPILAVAEEGEVAEVVRRSGIGVSVTPDAELAILDGLLTVVRMSETETPGAALELYDGYAGAATIERLLRTEALRVKPSTTQGAR